MTVEEATNFFSQLELTRQEAGIADKLLEEINDRLRFLNDVGLEYLTLDRLASTLSGGEAQRIQLATSLGSRLVGTLYVLDEPSIGLHTRDTERLIKILHDLRDLGNTILVVEHDAEIMRAADHIIDLGPGAGENGGQLIATGTYDEIRGNPASLTGRYLARIAHSNAATTAQPALDRNVKLIGARAHNLKNLNVSIPLGMLVCITGVSGSGKSTLVHDVLYERWPRRKGRSRAGRRRKSTAFKGRSGSTTLCSSTSRRSAARRARIQSPTSRPSTPSASCLLPCPRQEARLRAGHFSFNIPGGRCETCQGDGTVTVEMQFLADVELICEDCKGTRYKPEVLEVHYHGKNIHDVLHLTVKEALHFFSGRAEDPGEAASAGRSRPRLSAAGAVGNHALRRRSAAHEAGRAPATEAARRRTVAERAEQAHPRCSTSSTSRPPACTSTT